ncbi:hypothetical protein NCCP2222_34770 [Sporosarcina sp. NCCP-2222]|nr:hypothetical protein NCCP2222_34770 [Sporosarcina sp. NCCP-2222]
MVTRRFFDLLIKKANEINKRKTNRQLTKIMNSPKNAHGVRFFVSSFLLNANLPGFFISVYLSAILLSLEDHVNYITGYH